MRNEGIGFADDLKEFVLYIGRIVHEFDSCTVAVSQGIPFVGKADTIIPNSSLLTPNSITTAVASYSMQFANILHGKVTHWIICGTDDLRQKVQNRTFSS